MSEPRTYYIGYFQQLNQLPESTRRLVLPISTALFQPKWLDPKDFVVFDELSPKGIEHHSDCKECDHSKARFDHGFHVYSCNFLKDYFSKLCSLDWNKIYSRISSCMFLTEWKYPCIMVYEKPDNPCSERWILMWMFEKKLGIKLKDLSELGEI